MLKKLILPLVALFAIGAVTWAQVLPQPGPPVPIACAFNNTPATLTSGQAGWVQCTNDGKLQVNATVSASATISGFTPNGNYAVLTPTNVSSDVALPAGTDIVAFNSGTTTVSCVFAVGATTATANKIQIQPSSWMSFTVGANTHIACIDQTGSTSNQVVVSGGAGLATGAGGGTSSGGGTGPYNVTITNVASAPAIVTCTNCGAASVTGPFNVTITNTAAAPAFVSSSDIAALLSASIPAGVNSIGGVSIINSSSSPAVVTCTNCGAATVNGPFNVTVTNSTMTSAVAITGTDLHTIATTTGPTSWAGQTLGAITLWGTAPGAVTVPNVNAFIANTSSSPGVVTCTNCGAASVTGPFNVTITNTAAAPVFISSNDIEAQLVTLNATASAAIPTGTNTIGGVVERLTTTGGWTTALLNGLTSTVTAVKNSAGQLGKVYCYNSAGAVAYLQVFNLTPGQVTLGTTTPANSYGIPAVNASGWTQFVGDQFSSAISVAATTTVKGLTGSSMDCNVSYN